MKTLIQVILGVLMIVLAYLSVNSILEPLDFKKEQEHRYKVVVDKLKDIRKAQFAFKDVNGRYTGSFDTLINFVKYDSFPVVFKKGEIPEEMLGQITEKEAIAKGLIIRDTTRVNVLDSLFKKGYPIDSFSYIPFSSGKHFSMAQGVIVTSSKLKVNVFEVKAPSKYILEGLDMQEIVNFNDGWEYKGLKAGSLEEANNGAGNWE